MTNKNRHSQPFIIVIAVTAIVLFLSQFNTKFSIAGFETKPIEPLADIISLPNTEVNDSLKAVNDSLVLLDSIALAESLLPVDSSKIFDFSLDTTTALTHFFKSLNATRRTKNKTRIAYFGDSMIEGDLISQDLRTCMQDTFGGIGVGFVPITSIVAGFRGTIIHSFGNWETYHLLKNPPANHVLGISGYGFVTNTINPEDTLSETAASWVKYIAVNQKHLNKFYEIKLLYGKSTDDNYAMINGYKYPLKGNNPVNELSINASAGMQSLKATFYCKTPVDVFGFSMESDSGVFVDNFSFRGNSGMPNVKVLQSIYSGTNKHLDYDLIILEYGLNAVNPKVKDYSWYERGMDNVIKHLQASFPNTSILLVSVGDKGYRQNGVYQTDPSVPLLVETQKRLAKNNKIAFWSLYHAMGGYGSMVKWVQADTALANKDYTHFNFKGAHKVGKLFYSKLMNEYKAYNKKMGYKPLATVVVANQKNAKSSTGSD